MRSFVRDRERPHAAGSHHDAGDLMGRSPAKRVGIGRYEGMKECLESGGESP
jgi:hypothetical protein